MVSFRLFRWFRLFRSDCFGGSGCFVPVSRVLVRAGLSYIFNTVGPRKGNGNSQLLKVHSLSNVQTTESLKREQASV